MTVDYKKFAFQYADKIIFGVALIVFVLSAYSSIKSPSTDDISVSYADPKKKTEQILEREKEILTGLNNPAIPANIDKGGFATDPDLIYPDPKKDEIQCDHCALILNKDTELCPNCGKPPKPPREEPDIDDDGVPDFWEKQYPLYADWQTPDADRDDDKDGFTNLAEYQGSSHPGDRASIPVPIVVTKIKQRQVDILFSGQIKQKDGKYALLVNWGRGTEVRFIRPGTTFHGYLFDNPKDVWLKYQDGTRKKAVTVTIQKINMDTGDTIGLPKQLVQGQYIPEDELNADFRIIGKEEKSRTSLNRYVEDTIEVNDKIYIIQSIEKKKVVLKEQQAGIVITLYPKE